MTARIGMHDPSAGVHEEQASPNSIERVAEGCGFSRSVVHQMGDEHRSAHMWDDQPHALPGRIVDHAAVAAAPEAQVHKAGGRLVEIRLHLIDQALRSRPLLVKARLHKLAVRQEIRRANHLTHLAQEHRCRGGIKLGVLLGIRL
jgi:hypothetical protein